MPNDPQAEVALLVSGSRSESRGLKIKLLVGCLTPLVVGALCQAVYTVSAQKRALIGGLEIKARSLGELMVNVVGPSVAVDDRLGVRDALSFLTQDATSPSRRLWPPTAT